MALMAWSNEPAAVLIWSCSAGSADSMPIIIQSNFAVKSWLASSLVKRWPVVKRIVAASSPAEAISSTMSFLNRGSPPVKPMVIVPSNFICSMTLRACSVSRLPFLCKP